jgi:hypothetical protein
MTYFRYYPIHFVEEFMKTTENFAEDDWTVKHVEICINFTNYDLYFDGQK